MILELFIYASMYYPTPKILETPRSYSLNNQKRIIEESKIKNH